MRDTFVDFVRKGAVFTVVGLLGYNVVGLAQPANQTKWIQPPDEIGWDVNMTVPNQLADDFLCTQTGFITDIHLWTSYHTENPEPIPYPYTFNISIWSDVPAVPGATFSHPGEVLWNMTLSASATLIPTPPEGWLDPTLQEINPNDHVNMWQYDFFIPESTAFKQTAGNIYWLGVQAIPVDTGEPLIGWKSSLEHWNDDAVYMTAVAGWRELIDPRSGVSMDLAFALTTAPTVPDGGTSAMLLGLSLLGLWGAKRFMH